MSVLVRKALSSITHIYIIFNNKGNVALGPLKSSTGNSNYSIPLPMQTVHIILGMIKILSSKHCGQPSHRGNRYGKSTKTTKTNDRQPNTHIKYSQSKIKPVSFSLCVICINKTLEIISEHSDHS